ncbi:GntR family transcriptional regulator [Flavonifractor sp. HCP28S3_F3]|uniref:GntR family transcriptional regulator n=1 Tax=Flavonifractor sp. HCP28S3_F3 TaxID=3438939 RepID=UPI003F89EDC0
MEEKKLSYQSPLYLQLREVIRNKIENGDYPPGTKIPSENALAEQYGIHRLSVRSAISALVYEGLLKPIQGKGVFVASEKDERDLETVGGFKQTMQNLNRTPSTKLLTKALRPAGPYYAQLLDITPEEELFYIKRVCYSDEEPYSLEEVYIPRSIIHTIPQVDLKLFSLYDVYQLYNIRITRVEQSLEMSWLNPGDARLLDLDSSLAVLKFQGISRDQADRIVEYARTYTRADRCTFRVHYYSD